MDILSYTTAALKVRIVDTAIDLASRCNNNSSSSEPCSIETAKESLLPTSESKDNMNNEIAFLHELDAPRNLPAKRRLARPTLYQIQVLLKLWKRGLIEGDPSSVVNRYFANAEVVPFDSKVPLDGPQTIHDYYQKFIQKYRPTDIKVVRGTVTIPTADQIKSYGGSCWAQDTGMYDVITHSGMVLRMMYTFVYLRDEASGRWRIVRHSSSRVCVIPRDLAATMHVPTDGLLPGCGDAMEDERDDEPTTKEPERLPRRRPSQVNHLVDLLMGNKKVTQDDLILLSTSNTNIDEEPENRVNPNNNV